MITKYTDKKRLTIYIILAVIIATGLLYTFSPKSFPSKYDNDIIALTDGWSITYDGDKRDDISLSDAAIKVADKGDTFILVHELDDYRLRSACIQIKTIHSSFKVYLGDELIYDFASYELANDKVIPIGYVYVPLPDNYPGQKLSIFYTAGQDRAFSGFDTIYIGMFKDLLSMRSDRMRLQFYVGVFLCCLGVTFCALTPYLVFNKSDYRRVFLVSLIVLDLGTYILSTANIFNYFSSDMSVNTFFEYSSFYLMPAILSLYVTIIVPGPKLRRTFLVATIINTIAYLYSIISHIAGISIYSTHSLLFDIICLTQIPIALISTIYLLYIYKDKSKDEPKIISFIILLIGLNIFMICALIEITSFNVLKFISSKGEASFNHYPFTLGSLVLAVFIFIGYFEFQIYSIESDNRQQFLKGLAYYDPLTGLSNRARCQEEMLLADESKKSYVIISIDLDNLKKINDTYGHDEGDKYIKKFASMLSTSFRVSDVTGRMGGDEFIVILYEQNQMDADARIKGLQSRFSKVHFGQSDITYGFSYGIASNRDFPDQNAEKIYGIADIRMYEMKRKRHQNVKSQEA